MNNENHETFCNYSLTNLVIKLGFNWKEYFVAPSIDEHFHWEIPLHIAQKWLREDKKLEDNKQYKVWAEYHDASDPMDSSCSYTIIYIEEV